MDKVLMQANRKYRLGKVEEVRNGFVKKAILGDKICTYFLFFASAYLVVQALLAILL